MSLARAARKLGYSPDELRVLRAGGGGGAEVWKIRIGDLPGAYALRKRKPVPEGEPERWLAKDAVCAFLTGRFSNTCVDPIALSDFLSVATGADLSFVVGADLLIYEHGSLETERPAWSVSRWLDATPLIDQADAEAYAATGRCLRAVHAVQFPGLWPELDRPGDAVDWGRWIGFMTHHFATPDLAAKIGPDAVERIRRWQPPRPSAYVLLHGDVHPGNALVLEGTARLIDWDEACVGAPEQDFAVLRYRTRKLESGLIGPDEALFEAAVEGYRQAGGRLDAERIHFHQILFLIRQLAMPRQPRDAAMTPDELSAEVSRLLSALG